MNQDWLIGLAKALKDGGQKEAADVLYEAVGNDPGELGGVGKVIANYAKANPLTSEVSFTLKVDGVDHQVQFGGGGPAQGVALGIFLTAFLAQGS